MRQYRHRGLSMPVTEMSNSPVHPVPCPRDEAPPTRFKVKRSAYERKTSVQEFTVEVEYRKYALDNLSHNTDTLKYWEVRFMLLDGTMTHTIPG